MLTNEEKLILVQELEDNINAYLNALKRISIPAQERLNVKISKLANIKEKIEKEVV